MTLSPFVPLAVDIPLCLPPVDQRLMGSEGVQRALELHYLPIFLGWNSFSTFGHQVGASAQDLRLGNRFFQRGYEASLKQRGHQEGGGHPARNVDFGWSSLWLPRAHVLAGVAGWRKG